MPKYFKRVNLFKLLKINNLHSPATIRVPTTASKLTFLYSLLKKSRVLWRAFNVNFSKFCASCSSALGEDWTDDEIIKIQKIVKHGENIIFPPLNQISLVKRSSSIKTVEAAVSGQLIFWNATCHHFVHVIYILLLPWRNHVRFYVTFVLIGWTDYYQFHTSLSLVDSVSFQAFHVIHNIFATYVSCFGKEKYFVIK